MIIYFYFFPLNIHAIVVTDFIFENINLTQTVTIFLKQLSFKCIQIMKKKSCIFTHVISISSGDHSFV